MWIGLRAQRVSLTWHYGALTTHLYLTWSTRLYKLVLLIVGDKCGGLFDECMSFLISCSFILIVTTVRRCEWMNHYYHFSISFLGLHRFGLPPTKPRFQTNHSRSYGAFFINNFCLSSPQQHPRSIYECLLDLLFHLFSFVMLVTTHTVDVLLQGFVADCKKKEVV